MEFVSPKASPPVISCPFSSPNVGALLRKRILAWSQETGLSASVHVRVDGKVFNLHKSPLVLKSGYFKKALLHSQDVELPENFPGGSEIFKKVALFIYDSPIPFDPFNVAALRCMAEFLEMTEGYASINLCERSDLYINQVVLQSWDDTLIVLQKCQSLLPWSEDLLIVSRCVESLAFMACMEILDPEQRRDRPIVTLQSIADHAWSSEMVKEIAGLDLWIKDLIALPFEFFRRIIGSLRRQGMKDKYVSPIVVFYANKWVLSKKTRQFWKNTAEQNGADDANNKVSVILQGIIELLPMGEKASKVIPVGFYFALLSRSIRLSLSDDHQWKLQNQIASLLDLAEAGDFLLPDDGAESIASSVEFETMKRIISIHVSSNKGARYMGSTPSNESSVVADLWDGYLSQIAVDPEMEPSRFIDLIEIIPMSDRESHNHLYNAMNTFLLKHPNLSTEEKASVCKYLNCQKLSHEKCIQAVQNELMPLRLIIQALFVQQLNTHKVFKDCSESFRYMQSGEFSGSLSCSRSQIPRIQTPGEEIPYKQAPVEDGETMSTPLGFLLQKEVIARSSEIDKEDYESTSFRIQSLEQELMSLKRSLQRKNTAKVSSGQGNQSSRLFCLEGRAVDKRSRNPLGQVSTCIGSVSWAAQRKYASRLLKVLRSTVFGRGKSKRKQAATGLSNGSIVCRNSQLHEMYDC